ncbi:hypothetical protein AUC70_00640 [Methyloceanibacter stevinii]|uniref:Uncharacterized protein n=1 Tax=Methyloceanibacter stevinii TaxID=1774970 RepID=A0A1E3VRE8_9HYPH|nr:hypothetical protein AUC70_00640 [Methyloceanibacter stevinii]
MATGRLCQLQPKVAIPRWSRIGKMKKFQALCLTRLLYLVLVPVVYFYLRMHLFLLRGLLFILRPVLRAHNGRVLREGTRKRTK